MQQTYRRRRRRLNPRFVILCGVLACLLAGLVWGVWSLLRPEEPAAVPSDRSAVERNLIRNLFSRPLPGEGVTLPDYVEDALLTENPYSRPGTPLKKISGVVIHYVGNPNTKAKANRNYFESLKTGETGVMASSHFVVGLEGEVLQCVPLTEVAYASNQRNDDTVSIEVCHPDEAGQFSEVTYDRVVELTAWLCDSFELDPAEDVIRHYDVTGKECPRYYVKNPEAWEALRKDVAQAMEKEELE